MMNLNGGFILHLFSQKAFKKMKKRNYLQILIAVGLLIVSLWLITNKKSTTLEIESGNFAIDDTSGVDKIFLANRAGQTVLLEKTGNSWMVNKKYPVRKDAIQTLLHTFKNLHIKSPVPNSARNTVIKDMAVVGVKVEIYIHKNLLKTYYVGRETPDNLGTYMLIENAPNAFIMDIPGFNGYLTPRFITSETEWRDQGIFRYAPGSISILKLENHLEPENSFEIQVYSMQKFALRNSHGQEVADANAGAVFSFLSRFQQINYESLAQLTNQKRDSILQSDPIFIFKIVDQQGKNKELKIYRKYAIPGEAVQFAEGGKRSNYDVARMYAKMSDENQILLIQNFVFDKILPSLADLRQKQKNN